MPTMRQFKIGPYVRRERDKRTYGDILLGRDWSETRDWLRARRAPRMREGFYAGQSEVCVTYEGLGAQFHDLVGQKKLVRAFLETRAVRRPESHEGAAIAIHVRRGDFAPPDATGTGQNVQVPLDWYRHAYHVARERLGSGRSPSVMVFSDEDPVRITCELGLPNSSPEPVLNALHSIFLLSQARVLIGARSTFSLWGNYLGNGLSIWPRGFDLGRFKPVDSNADIFV